MGGLRLDGDGDGPNKYPINLEGHDRLVTDKTEQNSDFCAIFNN